jgi:hypothetical protein
VIIYLNAPIFANLQNAINGVDLELAGLGCSSLGYGALQELGPFRVNRDNQTLSRNKHAWNNGNFVQRGSIRRPF